MSEKIEFFGLSQTVAELAETDISKVAKYGWDRQSLIPLWFGEGDVPTPKYICDASVESMQMGETFYTHQNGLSDLRKELIKYTKLSFGVALEEDRLTVTNSGMMAISLAMQMLVNPDDEVVVIGPVWPNIYSTVELNKGIVTHASIKMSQDGWFLDLNKVFRAVTDRTKAIFVNTPGNPTGWIMPEEDQKSLVEFAREKNIWLISDEVYHSLVFDRPVATSMLNFARSDDKVIVVNSFSKSWLMTGWRMGWMAHPSGIAETLAKLVQISTSGVPDFIQRAGITALKSGNSTIAELRERCQIGRDIVFDRLEQWPRVKAIRPNGAFYAFFMVDGVSDSLDFCKKLIDICNVGLAPGSAFGPGGEGFLRLCYASTPEKLNRAMDALALEINKR